MHMHSTLQVTLHGILSDTAAGWCTSLMSSSAEEACPATSASPRGVRERRLVSPTDALPPELSSKRMISSLPCLICMHQIVRACISPAGFMAQDTISSLLHSYH